eukprot:TRINITY_DN4293_c0_g1_i1.p1 TRINITY_DN4293_c0_g1~~TRINITY_DN4293_c0_g1_i1.p1  ORF type:complete len:701 (-),score=272.63 TRINITY_DN4293_c0_g1_i1:86-2188(-)
MEGEDIEDKPDLSQVPKWVLVKLRDEMKNNLNVSQQLEKTKFELEQLKQKQSNSEVVSREEDLETIRKLKAANYEFMVQLKKMEKDREKDIAAVSQDKDAKIEQQKSQLAAAMKEIKNTKEASNSNSSILLLEKEEELRNKDRELRSFQERVSTLEKSARMHEDQLTLTINSLNINDRPMLSHSTGGLPFDRKLINDQIRESKDGVKKDRKDTVSNGKKEKGKEKEKEEVKKKNQETYADLDRLCQEVDRKSATSEFKPKTEKIQLEIAAFIARKRKLEYLINAAEVAKLEIPEIEKQIIQKRKDLNDFIKDINSEKVLKKKEKRKVDEMDNTLSILKDEVQRKRLLKKIPHKMALQPASFGIETCLLIGPDEFGKATMDPQGKFYGKGVSLYPFNKQTGRRDGDPIADRFCASLMSNGTIASLADGCGWGVGSRDAAEIASYSFVDYIKTHSKDINSPKMGGKMALRAFQHAQKMITKDATEETMFSVGTTAIMGALVLPLQTPEKNSDWILVCATVGDCKVLRWDAANQEIQDLVPESRVELDIRDPGGRLGPYIEGEADLRNLETFSVLCNEGDLILMMSDGVHDNYDPEYNGIRPSDLKLTSPDNSWKNVKDDKSVVSKTKADWMLLAMKGCVIEALETGMNTPKNLADIMIQHSLDITKASREYMEVEQKATPPDPIAYPGKMDHASILVITVGK